MIDNMRFRLKITYSCINSRIFIFLTSYYKWYVFSVISCGFVAFFVLQRCNNKNATFLWPQILFKREKTK